MKLRVGYVQCYEQPVEGSLDSTLIRVMDCSSGGGGTMEPTLYTNGGTEILYPKDPIAIDYPKEVIYDVPPPPPPPLPEDQPADNLQTITPSTVTPTTLQTMEAGSGTNNTLLIGGGLLLLFLLLGKNKKKKR